MLLPELQIKHAAEFRRCLSELDVQGIQKLWRHLMPNGPHLDTEDEVLIALHMARTKSESIRFKLRAYSHNWLQDRGMPSGLPDNLRPRAQRLYPRTVEGVGVSVNFQSQVLKPAAKIIRDDINAAILDEYAIDGTPKVESVKKAMENARRKAMKRLF